jgi:hypothetical protein
MEWLERLDELPRVLQEQLSGMVLYGTQLRCVGSTFLAAGHVLTIQYSSSPDLLITRHLDRGRVTVIETTTRIHNHYPNTKCIVQTNLGRALGHTCIVVAGNGLQIFFAA